MVDVTVASFEEMEPIFDGIARRARASLGVTGWGMQLMTLPRTGTAIRITTMTRASTTPIRRRMYIPLQGSGLLRVDDEVFELRPGMMARVGPEQLRQVEPGGEGIQFVALGAVPGSFDPRRGLARRPLPVPRAASEIPPLE